MKTNANIDSGVPSTGGRHAFAMEALAIYTILWHEKRPLEK
ncbi:MAG: hypothetical protein P8Y38_08495 [Deltaproteobacteria bacterium]